MARFDEMSLVSAFRPSPNQRLVGIIASTYSLDLVALLALLRVLANLSEDAVGDSKRASDLRAILRLAPRVVIRCQRGRVKKPSSTTQARRLALLDRCVREAVLDERNASWHAKFILAAYRDTPAGLVWRFWMGSRNLSQSTDLDYGLLLEGAPQRSAQFARSLPGLSGALEQLLAGLDTEIDAIFGKNLETGGRIAAVKRLTRFLDKKVVWSAPKGTTVHQISASTSGKYTGSAWRRQEPATQWRRLIAVSPFINTGGLGHSRLASWFTSGGRGHKPVLIATRDALAALKPETLRDFKSRAGWYAPSQQFLDDTGMPDDTEQLDQQDDLVDEDVERGRGIHAKLIIEQHDKGPAVLLLGSANFTARAMAGKNAELVARLSIPNATAERLADHLMTHCSVEFDAQGYEQDSEIKLVEGRRELNRARIIIAAELDLRLDFDPPKARVSGNRPVELSDDVRIEIAPMARIDLQRDWPRRAPEVMFDGIGEADFSEWISIRLSHARLSAVPPMAWLQKAKLVQPQALDALLSQRDAASLVALGLEGIRDLIAAEFGTAHGPRVGRKGKRSGGDEDENDALSKLARNLALEDVLRSRVRRPELWQSGFATRITDALAALERNPGAESIDEIKRLRAVWSTFCSAFGAR